MQSRARKYSKKAMHLPHVQAAQARKQAEWEAKFGAEKGHAPPAIPLQDLIPRQQPEPETCSGNECQDESLVEVLHDAPAELLEEVFDDEICNGTSESAVALRQMADEMGDVPLPLRGGREEDVCDYGDENNPCQPNNTPNHSKAVSTQKSCAFGNQGNKRYQNTGSRDACKRVVQNRTAKIIAAVSTRNDGKDEQRQNLITHLQMLIKRDRLLLVTVCSHATFAPANSRTCLRIDCGILSMPLHTLHFFKPLHASSTAAIKRGFWCSFSTLCVMRV
jgi:hypothetical protein